jgi:hypothetical protein
MIPDYTQQQVDFEDAEQERRRLEEDDLRLEMYDAGVEAYNDLQALEEITDMMRDIRDAWRSLPGQDTRGRAVVAAPHN